MFLSKVQTELLLVTLVNTKKNLYLNLLVTNKYLRGLQFKFH